MNATTVGSRVRRSPSTSRRNSREDLANADGMGAIHVDMLMPRVVVSGTRQRHHTGGGDSAAQEDLARLGRSGSWGGVNESEEDMAAKLRVGEYTPIKVDSMEEDGDKSFSEQTPVNGDIGGHHEQERDRSTSTSTSSREDLEDPEEESFRRRLAFFFFDPVQKYKARKQFPWKLALQFLKIILVTIQIIIFGSYRYAHTRYFEDNRVALEHLFLRNWDSVREINAYPPATGVFALYRKDSFYAFFDHVATTYDGVEGATINPVFKDGAGINFCVDRFGDGTVFPNLTWTIDFGHLEYRHDCIKLPEDRLANFSSKQYLQEVGFEVPWSTMSQMKLVFTLKTLTYTKFGPLLGPECFLFYTEIVFSNSDYDGQV